MITCNRCGNVAPAGAVQCQRCGAPLSSKVENTTYNNKGMMGGQEQGGQELPAWLESLRVGERSAAPAKSPSSFSAKDLVEEGSLPNWMRPEQSSGNQPVPPSPAPAALRPASFPGPNTDANMPASTNESPLAAKGFTARSLIDEQALPNWMKEGNSGKSGSMPPSGATDTPAPGNIAASSLVQPDALPDWMRNLQPPSPSPSRPAQPQPSGYPGPTNTSGLYAAPQPVMPPATPVMPPVPPTPPSQPLQSTQPAASTGFSARDLIDQNALPTWMNPQGGGQPRPAPSNSGPAAPAQPAAPTGFGAGFSAHDLIDQNALPTWMNPQGGGQAGATPNNSGPVAPAQPVQPGQSGFSASSLLDMDSLPSWLKEGGQPQRGGAAPAQPAQGWQSGSFPAPGTPPQQNMPWQQGAAPANSTPANAAGSGISAASFIDKDALPAWLRENDQQAPMGGNRSGAYAGGPQRVENMRVPSRPRGEIVPSVGESEEAANVFASMLGVASAAPNFPSAPPAPSMPAPPQPSPQPLAQPVWQPSQPGPASMAGAPAGGIMPQQPMRPPTANSIPGTPQPGMGNQQAQGYLGVYGGAQPGGQNVPNAYAMGNPPMGSPQIPPSAPGMPPMPGAAAGQIGNGQADVRPAKRGLFNSIREWFFR